MGIIIAYLLGILTAFKPKYHDACDNTYSSDASQRQSPSDRPISVMCIPPAESNEERAKKKKKERRKTVKFWVEVVGIFILFVYTSFTILIWWANKKSADAAKSAADTSLASERGWIKIADIEAGSDFWYTPTESFQMTMNYRLVNVGHSVITSIHFDAQMIPEYWGQTMIHDVIDKEIAWCNEKRKERPDPRELRTLFPGDAFWSDSTVSISKQEMYEANKTWPNPYGNREKQVIPVIIGCVSYRLPFSDDIHQTRFAYNVNFIDPTRPPIPAKSNLHGQNPFIIGHTIPQAQIDIRPHYFGGLYAD